MQGKRPGPAVRWRRFCRGWGGGRMKSRSVLAYRILKDDGKFGYALMDGDVNSLLTGVNKLNIMYLNIKYN